MSEFIGFDLEIAEPFPEGGWNREKPLGISCAATYSANSKYTKAFFPRLENGRYADRMSESEVKIMVDDILRFSSVDNYIVTWNGLGFDFLVLALEVGDTDYKRLIRHIALNHIDPFFNMFCDKGYGIGLQKAAEALLVKGKLEGMHGSLAPLMWNADFIAPQSDAEEMAKIGLRRGSKEAQELCIEYVKQDAKATYDVYAAMAKTHAFYWQTRGGYMTKRPWIPTKKYDRLLTCAEANERPEPDTSWMDTPRTRDEYIGWTYGH